MDYQLVAGEYMLRPDYRLPAVELSLTFWQGMFERWSDQAENLILTGAERAEQEHRRAEEAALFAEEEHRRVEEATLQAEEAHHRRAEQESQRQESQRAEQAQQRADRFAAQLRAVGIEPEGGDDQNR